MSIIDSADFSSKKLSVTVPKTLSSGAKQAYINYENGPFLFQTAQGMTVPFGMNTADPNDKYGPDYSVNLSFRGADKRPELNQFLDVMTQLDEFMIEEGVKNSVSWFKGKLGKDVVKAFYTPCVKYSKDKEGNVLDYPPNLKVKLRKVNNEFETKFYDLKGTPYRNIPPEELLVKGVQVTAIIQCTGVWFAGSKFGLTWRAKQIAIHKLPERITDFAFKGLSSAKLQDNGDEEEQEENDTEVDDEAVFKAASAASAASAVSTVSGSTAVSAVMPTLTEEEEEGDDVEPIPAPKKTIVKKKIIGKK
jgi:hypothetical protein